jgi:2-amino-4-hydroxy-6-hydroxymethyldihydropteridine diphosphokinase
MVLDRNKVFLLLGSNMGARLQLLNSAIENILIEVGEVTKKSSVYETEAWGITDQPGFLNIALEVETPLSPLEVLTQCLAIESRLGRIREEKWGARFIDIDIIFYNHDVINIPDKLQVPHPEMQHRKFVLEPLAEIAPDFVHPILKKPVASLLFELNDPLEVIKIKD